MSISTSKYYKASSEILEKMLSNVTTTSTAEGSFAYDVLSPVSMEVSENRLLLDEVVKRIFAKLQYENGYIDELILKCQDNGITRKDGTKATGQATFTGAGGTTIPAGTLVATDSGLKYNTLNDTIIPLDGITATADIQAVEVGINYNKLSGMIKVVPTAINGITAVTNANPVSGGTDKEDIESLYNRYVAICSGSATSGNIANYKQWTTSIEGVGACKVLPLWQGAGTVKLVIVSSDFLPATIALKNKVKAVIDPNNGDGSGLAPMGAVVTVEGATANQIDISAVIELDKTQNVSVEAVEGTLRSKLQGYFKDNLFNTNKIYYLELVGILSKIAGINKVKTFLVNGTNADISLGETEFAIIDDISIKEA